MKRAWVFLVILMAFDISASRGQESGQERQLEELKNEIAKLRATIESLKALQAGVDPGELLEERFEDRVRQVENKIDAIARSTAQTALNPRTTAFINFAARTDNKTVFDASGTAEISNRMFLRTVEVDLRASVDPYAEAITVLAIEDEAGTGFAAEPEEAYGIVKRLPVFETAPLGLKLKIGKYRAPLGVNNRLHLHDVPWTTRPLVVSKYLGTEHGEFFESGFNPVGIDLDFFLPRLIPTTTMEMNLGVVRSGELGFGQALEQRQPAYTGHLTISRDWNNVHLLTLGGSAYVERGNGAPRLFGVDLTYKWSPAERRQWQSVVVGGEMFSGVHSMLDTALAEVQHRPFGWYAYGQYQLSYRTYIGARYDRVQEPNDAELVSKSWSMYISYYTTEFLRFRLGFQRLESDALAPDLDGVNSFLLDVNFVFGSHPTEPYWINR